MADYDETVFARLRISCGDKRVVSAIEAGEVLCGLTDEHFGTAAIKETSVVLARRWPDFLAAGKRTGEKVTEWTSSMGGEEAAGMLSAVPVRR